MSKRSEGCGPFDPRRELLLELFHVALAAVDGRRRVRAALAGREAPGPVSAFAVGKAAASMMLGAADALGARLERGLVVAPDGAIPPALANRRGMLALEAGHPRPDERSLAAGAALLAFAAATPPGSRVLLLVSGGASALLEVPAPGVGLAELGALFERSLREGLDIEQLNRERIALSRVKGGRLAGLFKGAAIEALMISDVPRDDPAVLASGSAGHAAARAPARRLDRRSARRRRAGRGAARAARSRAARSGSQGDAEAAARRICHELAVGEADLHVHGGETVVAPARSAPAAAGAASTSPWRRRGASRATPTTCCSRPARTGATAPARMPARSSTAARSARAASDGIDPAAALAAADTGPFLEATGDLVHTGPTGTNVGDIVLALRQAPPDNGRM